MARASSRTARKGNVATVDFTGVEGRIDFTEGDHLLEVMEVTVDKGPAGPYWSWKFAAADGDENEGAVVYNNTSLSPAALWNLRTLLEALGVEVPDGPLEVDLYELAGLQVMGSIELETYEGKKKPRLADFWAADETPEEPEPKAKAGRRGAKAEEPEDDAPELTARQKRAAARKAAKEEPEEKEEAKPSRSSRGSRAAAKEPEPEDDELTEEAVNDMTEEELEDLIKEEKLDVDLADFKTLRKMRAAVIDAAAEAGLFEEEEPEPEPEEKPARRRPRR